MDKIRSLLMIAHLVNVWTVWTYMA